MATAKQQPQAITKTQRNNAPFVRPVFNIPLPRQTLVLGKTTKIMGVVNVTPDSFSGDGCLKSDHHPVDYAHQLIAEGADILDIGGESSRPGAKPVEEAEEIKRVIPVIKSLAKKHTVTLSIDTYKPTVAMQALEAGASIVNTIMGAKPDRELLLMVRNYKAGVILMHMKGTPRTMQKHITYRDLINDIISVLKRSIENCLEIGIKSDKIIIDPGIGFGKSAEHNLIILNQLEKFQALRRPIAIGTSRKSFIGKLLNKEVHERLYGSLATACMAVTHGAHIIRAHDVKETKEALTVTDHILQTCRPEGKGK